MTEESPAPVVRPAPDPARDARVARRRAEDARRAGRALDALLGDMREATLSDKCDFLGCSCCLQLDNLRRALANGK
jgi:hypothetical protein